MGLWIQFSYSINILIQCEPPWSYLHNTSVKVKIEDWCVDRNWYVALVRLNICYLELCVNILRFWLISHGNSIWNKYCQANMSLFRRKCLIKYMRFRISVIYLIKSTTMRYQILVKYLINSKTLRYRNRMLGTHLILDSGQTHHINFNYLYDILFCSNYLIKFRTMRYWIHPIKQAKSIQSTDNPKDNSN